MAATATRTGNPVVDAINAEVTNGRVRLAMLIGAHLESGWNTHATGDNGQSHGAFQIYFAAHPGITVAQAEDPVWATRYMLGSYTAGVARVPERMWSTDPKNAAALAAFYAERPRVMYPQRRIDNAWDDVQRIGTGSIPGAGAGAPTASTAPATGTATGTATGGGAEFALPNPLGGLSKDITSLVLRGLFALGGIGLVVLGVWRTAR